MDRISPTSVVGETIRVTTTFFHLPVFIYVFLSNQRRANKKEAMELDNEIESRLSAAQTTLNIQVIIGFQKAICCSVGCNKLWQL